MNPIAHPLDLYRLAVQHPLAEVAFVEHVWAHHHDNRHEPMLLREDFAGTCAVAASWCASDPDRQAMAIEWDEPTARWACDRFDDPDLHILVDDVMLVDGPEVDVTLALNFSSLIYHDRHALDAYFAHARRCLRPGGLLILDVFGGASVHKPSIDRRRVDPDEGGIAPFDYLWEQRGLARSSKRIDCRIHFDLLEQGQIQNAFCYDWRLWSPNELIASARAAGFTQASFWWSPPGVTGRFQPIDREPDAPSWVGYVVCRV